MKNEFANIANTPWSSLSYEEKNELLFLRQKDTLDKFQERGAISKAQYDKSLHDLIEKMGIEIHEDRVEPTRAVDSI